MSDYAKMAHVHGSIWLRRYENAARCLIEEKCASVCFVKYFADCRSQRGFAVVNVTDGTNVYVWLCPLESFLSHQLFFLETKG